MSVKLQGFKELDNMLAKLPQNVENRAIQAGLMGAMRKVAKAIRGAAPRNQGDQSKASRQYGSLYSNIRVKTMRYNKGNGKRGAVISTGNAFWGNFLEFGTRYIAARPWFLPTFNASQQQAVDELKTRLTARIEKEMKALL